MTEALASQRVMRGDGTIEPATVRLEGQRIAAVADGIAADAVDLGRRLLAPGLIDIHGDAFERQVMPRPGVMVDLGVAIEETERQLLVNGITTALHGLTWSWEPGLRSTATGTALIAAMDRLRSRLACDHRWHLRVETFNLDGLDGAMALIRERTVDVVAFNDHTPSMAAAADKPTGNIGNAVRRLVGVPEFNAMARAAFARAGEVDAGIVRLAAAVREAGLPLLSHDDPSPDERARFRALGAATSEFPKTLETARAAIAAGDTVVMGAPNVLRGRSHVGWLSATEAVSEGVCTALASDYFYPSLLHAAYRLVALGIADLPRAWRMITSGPAAIAGLADRGTLSVGQRADLLVVDDDDPLLPRVIGTMVGGRWALRGREL